MHAVGVPNPPTLLTDAVHAVGVPNPPTLLT